MKRVLMLILPLSILVNSVFAQQDSLTSVNKSPYKTSFKVDGPLIAAGLGLNVLGFKLIQNKEGLKEDMLPLDRADVPVFDRFTAGDYSENADKISYYPFYASFAMPVAMLLNKNAGSKAGQVMALYVETMALTGALYTITAGAVDRSRPFTYGTEAPLADRTKKGAQRSFFAGHTAATASATFFAAKVFSDFNPDSKAKPYVWAAAGLIPATVGYYRLRAGMHFLSDNLIGYAVGAGAGILVPHLHKKATSSNLSVVPFNSRYCNGLQVSYTFK